MSKALLLKFYYQLSLIRRTEEKIAELYPRKEIKCPTHLCMGQEAIAVGVCANLRRADKIVSFYRGHGHFLAKGGNLGAMMAELYGKATGVHGGRGGSMLLSDPRIGDMGSSAIVGGGIPIAVGLALAAKMKRDRTITVSFFGDAAVEEGVFHESMNFASLHKLPVVFICENNLYAVAVHIRKRQSNQYLARYARSYGMPSARVDGNDVLAVYRVARRAIERARRGGGPTLIECLTQRLRGHIESFIENTENRDEREVRDALKHEPLKRYSRYLLRHHIAMREELEAINRRIDKIIAEAVAFAEQSPFPNPKMITDYVYPNANIKI